MINMEVCALFATDKKPQNLETRGFSIDDGYECKVPLPLPDMVLVFALGTWPTKLKGKMLRIQVSIEDMKKFTIGSITEENRSLCWQGEWRDDLYIKSELMIDPESTGMLLLVPEPSRPITPPCIMFTPQSKKRKEEPTKEEMENEQLESSQTESQQMEMLESQRIEDDDDEMLKISDDKIVMSRLHAVQDKKEDADSESEACTTSDASEPVIRKPSTRKSSASVSSALSTSNNKKKRKASALPPDTKSSKSSATKRPTRTRTCQSVENKTNTLPESKPKVLQPKRDITSFMKIGPKPSPRWGHSLCDIGNHQALLIGGQGFDQVLAKDSVWLLNTDTKEWEVPSVTMDTHSHYRMGHTATFDPKVRCLYVFGGSKNLRWYNDIHVLDLDDLKWSLVQANGKAPTRAYHTSTLFRNELFVFGGVFPNTDPEPDGCSNQVFVYSPVTESWYEPVLLGDRPIPRSGHSATLLGDKLVIFGGWDAPQCYNDLHILDLCLMEFTSPSFSGKAPSPRTWHGAMALPGNRVLIHGGYDGDKALGDSFIFHLDSMSWTSIKLSTPVSTRAGHSLLNVSPDVSILSSSTEDQDEKENTPKKMPQTKKITQKMMVFAGGDNDGAFFNDLLRVSLKLEDV